jgi:hypothetical protein
MVGRMSDPFRLGLALVLLAEVLFVATCTVVVT